jgi:uncharacterized protein
LEPVHGSAPDIAGRGIANPIATIPSVSMRLTANEIRRILNLQTHPTCGFVAETYRSALRVPASALAEVYGGDRSVGSALYFLVTPDAHIVMHRIRSDQQYHHYLGDPLEVLMLFLASTEWPGVEPPDVEKGDRERLIEAFPAYRQQINDFMASMPAEGQPPRAGS